MAFRQVITALALFLGVDLLLLALLPALRLFIDPLLILLVALAFGARSTRFLWMLGLGIGFLKDLTAGTLFGAWTFTFAGAAWMIGATRQMVEWEDSAVIGVWTAILTFSVWLFYGFWLTLADPFIRWGNGQHLIVPAAMVAQGLLAAWIFPRLRKFLKSAT